MFIRGVVGYTTRVLPNNTRVAGLLGPEQCWLPSAQKCEWFTRDGPQLFVAITLICTGVATKPTPSTSFCYPPFFASLRFLLRCYDLLPGCSQIYLHFAVSIWNSFQVKRHANLGKLTNCEHGYLIWLVTCMKPCVLLDMWQLLKPALAVRTLVWLLPRVNPVDKKVIKREKL